MELFRKNNIQQKIKFFKKGGVQKFKEPSGNIKPNPNMTDVISETWDNENNINTGLQSDGTWKPYYDKVRNQWLIGPGYDYSQNGRPEFAKGATKAQIDKAVADYHKHSLDLINTVYLPKFTERPDTVSPQIKAGLLDLRYQTGNIRPDKWPRLGRAIATGDLLNIQKEGQVKGDTRRNQNRNKKNWTYNKKKK